MSSCLECIFKTSSDLLIKLDSDKRIVLIGKRVLENLQFQEEELINQPYSKFFKEIVFDQSPMNSEWRAKNGEVFPVRICITRITDSEDIGFLVVAEDMRISRQLDEEVRSRKFIENQYQEREAKINVLLDESSDPIFSFQADGTYIYVNNIFGQQVGKRTSEIIGKKIWDVFSEDEANKRFRVVKEVFATGVIRDIEVRVPTPNGDVFYLTTVKPILDDNNQVKFVICISKNITDIKRVREELEKAKEAAEAANMTKSEFLSNTSHEIRTPLNAIIGFSELLKNRVADKKSVEYLNGIITAGKNLFNIINDLLDLSKIESGRFEAKYAPTSVYSVCNELDQIFSIQAKQNNINLTFDINADIPKYLMLDEMRLRQILLNLVGNALKFTHKGYVRLKAVGKQNNNTGNMIDLCFEIEDTGIGIQKDQQEKIFEAFYQQDGQNTRKYGGTGLGLTISEKLSAMLNGVISVESEPGKGSTFRLYLKNVAVAAVIDPIEVALTEDIEGILFKGSKILYAEDLESNRIVIRGYLEKHEILLVEADNGHSAVELAREQKPDLILMDIHMPVMDGFSALKSIREDENIKGIPVIALTASAMNQDSDAIRKVFDGFLPKPVTRYEFLKLLQKYLPYEKVKHNSSKMLHWQYANWDVHINSEDRKAILSSIEKIEKGMVVDEMLEFLRELEVLYTRYNSSFLKAVSIDFEKSVNSYDATAIEELLERLKQE